MDSAYSYSTAIQSSLKEQVFRPALRLLLAVISEDFSVGMDP